MRYFLNLVNLDLLERKHKNKFGSLLKKETFSHIIMLRITKLKKNL